MKYLTFAVRDVAVNAFSLPFHARTVDEARRMFSDACSDSKNELYKHPKDYELWLLGTWDDEGIITGVDKGERVCTGHDMLVVQPTVLNANDHVRSFSS